MTEFGMASPWGHGPAPLAFSPRRVASLVAAIAALVVALCGGCATSADPGVDPKPAVVRVPTDAPTISEAVAQVAEGGLVLISPGTYRESVTVATPGVTLRGTDRNQVVIDGEGLRATAVVVTAPGVTVANLTVRSATLYGLLVTGMPDGLLSGDDPYPDPNAESPPPLQRFLVDHVTAINNGLYGIYAFVTQHGVISNSYASGSADSGIYVGQCRDCDIVVTGNIAERNAVGFENANASDSLYVVGNRWSGNRVGMTMLSSFQESLRPQRGNVVAGNLISDNHEARSPAQADGAFGIGLGISGGQDNTIRDNTIIGHPQAGILINNAVDIPATGNSFTGNAFGRNGLDVADVSGAQAPSSGNCVSAEGEPSVEPAALAAAVCPQTSARAEGLPASELPNPPAPAGMAFLDVPEPRDQPNLADAASETVGPPLPGSIGEPDLSQLQPPPTDLLSGSTGTR